ncbi:MAG: glutamate-semialdehyde -aminomutase [Chloroflexi bacterium]|nr:glutamate-semialdehyde -aminomutase [Chloroflexota bacterium]
MALTEHAVTFNDAFAKHSARSHELFESALGVLPGGVNSTARTTYAGWDPYPLFAAGGEGPYLFDVDGHHYVDYLLALGPLMLGHRPQAVIDRVAAEVQRLGTMFALPYELEQHVARKFLQAVPSAEAVRFTNTGSEAVGSAVRLARAATGRQKLLRFEGHYHGWQDTVYWSNKPEPELAGPSEAPNAVPAGPGVPAGLADTLIICPWNDPESVERAFAAHGGEIAAVLTEPVMCNTGCILPDPGYLEFLREITRRHGALLIFDEVITGFRLSLGGAQGYYGVQPDLSTFAKALGGGFPVAALAGTWPVMRLIADGRYSHSGTYNANVVAMAAVDAALDELSRPGAYEELHRVGERLMVELRTRFTAADIPVQVQGLGPVFQVWFADRPIRSWRDAREYARTGSFRMFWEEMVLRGVLFHPNQFENLFISTAHADQHIDETLAALDDALPVLKARLAEGGAATK